MNDGWAVWAGGRDYIQGIWPGEKIGRTEHAHAHIDGPLFNHGHRDGRFRTITRRETGSCPSGPEEKP